MNRGSRRRFRWCGFSLHCISRPELADVCHQTTGLQVRCRLSLSLLQTVIKLWQFSISYSTCLFRLVYIESNYEVNYTSKMTINFGWSLSDTSDDPGRTGLANFRHKLLLHQRTTSSIDDEESTLLTMKESQANSIDQLTKPYRREPSVSQCSDSCFGSEYPSLTSTGILSSNLLFHLFELNQLEFHWTTFDSLLT